ncbi:ATP-binding protein [Pseudooceanicola batsensis]|uniref:ATP-binding protein n=1 Tax=Pseudooceanicola batsensis TaxID=314255 RepID=UPI0002F3C6BC|nr:ATP-binding protein [Pseudooceanicola batsensis]
MKHKTIDLTAEVKRATLPDGLQGFLFPTYEAISNAFHSIENRWENDLEDKGRLDVTFDDQAREVTIKDNGSGFDEANLSAFLTPLTGNKYERGGKGFGRFMAFKVYSQVFYSSGQKKPDGMLTKGCYRYDPFSNDDNLIVVKETDGAGAHPHDCGVTVSMRSPKADFEDYFVLEGKDRKHNHTAEDIVSAVLDHFLIEFIQKKVPKHFVLTIQGATFNLYKYFHESLAVGGSRKEEVVIGTETVEITFDYFKVGEEHAKKHRLYFYANNRAASDLENISSGLNSNPFTEMKGEEEFRYYYLVAVSSDFFKSSQSRDRITNLHAKIHHNKTKKSIKDHLIAMAKAHILDLEQTYTSDRRLKMKEHVDHLIAIDPLLRRGLGGKTSEEFVKKRGITETREQLAQDLFVERFRQKFDFTKLSEETSVEDLVRLVRDKIPEDAKEALAVYVAYRNNVIQVFRQLLNKDDDGLATEDKVHKLIYPRYRDSEQIDYASHNLWLIDDDLAYARYISSDRTPEGNARRKGEFAHDLLINNDDELMIVEMKRPQKKDYDSTKEADTKNPVDQLKNQVLDIRERGKVITSGGREISIDATSMVRGYILADWNDKLERYLKTEDFIRTNFGGQMAYRYYRELNLIIEVLAFDRLIDRASNRNEAFVSMLEGRSNFDRKSKGTLSAAQ